MQKQFVAGSSKGVVDVGSFPSSELDLSTANCVIPPYHHIYASIAKGFPNISKLAPKEQPPPPIYGVQHQQTQVGSSCARQAPLAEGSMGATTARGDLEATARESDNCPTATNPKLRRLAELSNLRQSKDTNRAKMASILHY